jgi:RNA 2',3'-cyclic 3'-phosphodiesterase
VPRLFYGVDIPGSVKSDVKAAQKQLKEEGVIADSWTNPALLHVTVLFLGMLDGEELPGLMAAGRSAVQGVSPFSIWTGKFGVFAKNRILWLGFAEEESDVSALKTLNRSLNEALSGKLPVELDTRPYRAHLTLARKLKEATKLDQANQLPRTEIRVTELCLFESTRIDGVLQYPVRHRFAFT